MTKQLTRRELPDEVVLIGEHELPIYTDREEEQAKRQKKIQRYRLCWQKRRLFGKFLGIGVAAAIVIAFAWPVEYTARARLMPPDQSAAGGLAMLAATLGAKVTGSSALGEMGSDLLGLKTTADLFQGILQSQTVQDDVAQKFNLRRVYHKKYWQDARKKLASRTDISVDRKSQIVTLEVSDRSPRRAAAMAQEYVDELNRIIVTQNTGSAHKERVFLEGRLAQVKQALEVSEKNFSAFASKNTTIDLQAEGRAMIAATASLEGQMIAARTELEGLRRIFTDNNIRVKEVQARIDELTRQLQKLGGTPGGAPAEPPGNAAAASANTGNLYPPIRQLPVLGVSYADLYRQTKIEEAVYAMLTQQYEMAKMEEAKETPSVKLLDRPTVPEKKSSPHRWLVVLGGTLFSGLLCVAWVLGNARWEETDPRDPGKLLAQEVLHSVHATVRAGIARYSGNGTRAEALAKSNGQRGSETATGTTDRQEDA